MILLDRQTVFRCDHAEFLEPSGVHVQPARADAIYIDAIGGVLERAHEDHAFTALMLVPPSESELALAVTPIDPEAIHAARTALIRALAAAHGRFGAALLLDVHSMPPLPGNGAARIVIGDRFGRSASGRLVNRIEAAIAASGHQAALNAPYPGGHILSRHGRPAHHVHAIQIEIDRRLYLDSSLTMLGKGFDDTAMLLRRIIDAAADELLTGGLALAAE